MKEDARESAYETLRVRLRDADREIGRLKGAVVVHRSKREQAEAMLDGLVAWVQKLSGLLKGELLICGRSCASSPCFVRNVSNIIFCFEVLSGRAREEEEAVRSELSRLDDPAVRAENPLWMDIDRA